MGVLDKCSFQGKVRTTEIFIRERMKISCRVPLYHLSSPILTELHQPLISKEDSYTLEILKKTPCIGSMYNFCQGQFLFFVPVIFGVLICPFGSLDFASVGCNMG